MLEDKVGVEAYFMAFATDEGLVGEYLSHIVLAGAVGLSLQLLLLLIEHQVLVDLSPVVEGHPYTA